MSKLQSFRLFLNERLTAVALEIFEAAQDTFIEYKEENDRLRRLLQITPEMQLSKLDSLQFSLRVSEEEVSSEQQPCEQEWNPSLGQENPEPRQIKEEQQELSTSQEEEQHHEVIDTNPIFSSTFLKSECDQEGPVGSLIHPQTQTVENRESDSKPPDMPHFDTVTHLTGINITYGSPSHQTNASNHNSAVSSDTVDFYNSPPVDKYCSKPRTSSQTTPQCRDCGETFKLKAHLQNHVTFSKRPSECSYCMKCYDSTCKLRAHVKLCHVEKSCTCHVCGETFKLNGVLSRHMRTHTGDCEKRFTEKGNLEMYNLIHTGDKPFCSSDSGKSLNQLGNLTMHKLTHTGEKSFCFDDFGKSLCLKRELKTHQPTHTREKPFVCEDCGKSFSQKRDLCRHILIHTGEKPFSCGDCGKRFNRSQNLKQHKLTHTREKPFSCGDCGKSFRHQVTLVRHKQTHTGQNPFGCGDGVKTFICRPNQKEKN